MGRPYAKELSELPYTYDWATEVSVEELSDSIQGIGNFPLLSIGSGGSLTAAAYWAAIHELETGYPSKHGTPLDLVSLPSVRPYAVGLVSAGGNNPDVVKALAFAARGEARGLVSLTLSRESKLSAEARLHRKANVVSFQPPVKKDGFLATNSLLSSMVHIYRAYCKLSEKDPSLPPEIPQPDIVGTPVNPSTYSVLYAGWAHIAAIDFESKLVEGALADVHCADLRNFAHGRHHWIAKRGASTIVVALITPEWRDLFNRTLDLLPSGVKVIRIQATHEGPLGAIELVNGVMQLIGQLSSLQGCDPGRPTVPMFGRKLYHMRANGIVHREKKPSLDLLIHRKFGSVAIQRHPLSLGTIKEGLSSYLDKLQTTRFRGIVFDYDETLCPAENRFGILPASISDALATIVGNDVVVGIATGRGRSVGVALRDSLDEKIWKKIIVGYYNGSQILRLDEGDPQRDSPTSPLLSSLLVSIQNNAQLTRLCDIEERPNQITLSPRENVSQSIVQQLALELVSELNMNDISVVCSSHSVDLLGPEVSKLSVVQECLDEFTDEPEASNILRIGDSGSWSGNDFALLATPLGLSSSDCPANVEWSWNLAASGHVGPDATLDYIGAMKFTQGSFSIDVKALVGKVQ